MISILLLRNKHLQYVFLHTLDGMKRCTHKYFYLYTLKKKSLGHCELYLIESSEKPPFPGLLVRES